jgi:1-deoxyxylulose-5-phosphate synthase
MKYRTLGRSGLKLSPIVLGTMNFGGPTSPAEAQSIVETALRAGINLIDTADIYHGGESERITGEIIRKLSCRDDVLLATKGHGRMGPGPNDVGNSRYHIIRAAENSLRRLGVDHIDLYQIHRPQFDIPQEETLYALDHLVTSGKVGYIGCSTYPAWLVMEALSISDSRNSVRYVSEQPPYNLLDRRIENELLPLAERYGLGILPWSPLAGGILAGRYGDAAIPPGSRRDRQREHPFSERVTPQAVAAAREVGVIAMEIGLTSSQLALAWVTNQPGITAPIVGPRTLEHLVDAIGILEVELEDPILKALDGINGPGDSVSDFFNGVEWMKSGSSSRTG